MILRHDSQQLFGNDDSNIFPKSFVGFVQFFSDEAGSLLKRFALVAYRICPARVNVSNAYKRWFMKRRRSLVAFLPIECAPEKLGGENAFSGSE